MKIRFLLVALLVVATLPFTAWASLGDSEDPNDDVTDSSFSMSDAVAGGSTCAAGQCAISAFDDANEPCGTGPGHTVQCMLPAQKTANNSTTESSDLVE